VCLLARLPAPDLPWRYWRPRGFQNHALFQYLDLGGWIDGGCERKGLCEAWFEVVKLFVSGAELCLESLPGNKLIARKHMEPVGQPQVRVERSWIVADCFDRGLFDRDRMLLQLLKEPFRELSAFQRGSCRVPGCCQAEELLVLLTSF